MENQGVFEERAYSEGRCLKGNTKDTLSIFQNELKIFPRRRKVNGEYRLGNGGAGTPMNGYLICDKWQIERPRSPGQRKLRKAGRNLAIAVLPAYPW
jgi:hypothetical protein